jgi:hypothetical protein
MFPSEGQWPEFLKKEGRRTFLERRSCVFLCKNPILEDFVGCTIARVWKCLISIGCTIARVWNFCRLHYSQVATTFVRGKNEHFLDASRRRSFYGEVASEWFGSYSLS